MPLDTVSKQRFLSWLLMIKFYNRWFWSIIFLISFRVFIVCIHVLWIFLLSIHLLPWWVLFSEVVCNNIYGYVVFRTILAYVRRWSCDYFWCMCPSLCGCGKIFFQGFILFNITLIIETGHFRNNLVHVRWIAHAETFCQCWKTHARNNLPVLSTEISRK